MMPRVVNSLGPFRSSSKIIPRRAGKSVLWISCSFCKASAVVHNALRHSRTS